MRQHALPATLLLLALVVAPAPRVLTTDDAPRPAPPAVAADPCRALVEDLRSGEPVRRARAEAALAQATPELLRAVIAELAPREALSSGEAAGPALAPSSSVPEEGPTVLFESSIVRATPAGATSLLALGTPDAHGLRRYDRARLRALIETQVAASPASMSLVTAPSVAAPERQESSISLLSQVAYVQDYDVEVGMGGAFLADPIVANVSEGLTLRLTAHRLGAEVWVDAHVDLAELTRPIAEASITLAGAEAAPVRVQLPEVRTTRWERSSLLAPGAPVLLVDLGPSTSTSGERLLVFLEVTVVEQPGKAPAHGK